MSTAAIKTSKISLLALFLTIFVDAAGMALVYPVLTPLFVHNTTYLFDPTVSEHFRNFLYGFVLAIYPIMMFIGSPLLGVLSDKYGRRLILIICMTGNLIGLLIMGLGVMINSVTVIILSRIISGVTAASLPVAQAAIIDLSTEQTKARNISLITAANSFGFIVGPIITGILSYPFFGLAPSLSAPFFFAALLPTATLYFLIAHFKETYPGNKALKLNMGIAFQSIYLAFRNKATVTPLWILTGFLVGYYIFFNYMSMFALLKFGYDQFMVSVLLGSFAVTFATSFLFIIPKLTSCFSLNKCLLISIAPQFVCTLLLVLFTYVTMLWTVAILIGIFVPCSYVVLLSILSNKTEGEFQGRIMGVSSSVNSFAWGFAPLLTAIVQPYSILLPLVVATIILLATLFLSINYLRNIFSSSLVATVPDVAS
ncbi:transporter of the major facilitator superfamily (MFS) [Legionella nautarum]|uniref:Transporter of the major facilitator superfamily (MFS) n=1 Tax=Legionella nautarum TaxID=45070 RepID=A0A0W0WYS0_9GAMM|nr:MFS transporter [Legionella nautarum]KTD37463.1 transporter of the major facilitator superfamily (MFS) [Legionella nautarum]